MTASEQATLNFYKWDYKYRGYYLFETPVELEPPYTSLYQTKQAHEEFEDDGKVPSLFKQLGNLFIPPKKEIEIQNEEELTPLYIDSGETSVFDGFSIRFSFGEEINVLKNKAFLNMLSYSHYPISFEIIGRDDEITIQFVCDRMDRTRLKSQLKAYFPTVIFTPIETDSFGFNRERNIAICDFGISDEFVRPINTVDSFSIDPLTSIIATLDTLRKGEIAIFQILFKGITSPLVSEIPYAVSDGRGGSFFEAAPEMVMCAKEKIETSLFSVVMRIASQGNSDRTSQSIATELARNITKISESSYNALIPLSNEGYNYDFHEYNLHHRLSNRFGFILNSKELNTFLHYPNKSVVSQKLGLSGGKTKEVPKTVINQKYLLGTNHHNGVDTEVMLNDEMRLRHKHIIGATGVGKSTLIANMLIEDMNAGNGCALFDPHGDIVEDILLRIPEHRKNDVIVIDPSDENYSVGFNLLGATTDAEKIVLSSDLVSSFKRHATAWGDNMSAVLSNAINTFLESSRDGTLIELKRFLLEDSFRKEFLTSVQDPSIHYYWNNEYAMVQKRIAPLLTRIDTFLRPKVIRYMLAQTGGVDFKKCIEEKKIVLIKLSQGLIGEENSFLLGSIFLSKFNQVAQGRQSLPKSQRHPYYIYLDEFQNFITPSITRILSGARKYGLGLVLAHQELGQIDDTKILNSVISNPYTRICFRLGDSDAKRLESGFSYFEQSDLQSLGTGEAIMRVGSSQNDFNISTFPLPKTETEAKAHRNHIIENTRNLYSKTKAELDALLLSLLPKQKQYRKEVKEKIVPQKQEEVIEVTQPIKKVEVVKEEDSNPSSISEKQKNEYLKKADEQETLRKHRSIQNFIRTIAHQRGYKVSIEEELPNGKRVDVGLVKDDIRIAIEVSVSNSNKYEAQNILKCINHGYQLIYLVSESDVHLKNIKKEASKILDTKQKQRVFYIKPDELVQYLDIPIKEDTKAPPKRVKGWRVDVNYHPDDAMNMPNKSIASKLKNLLKKKK
jgi:hypothetical protein